MLCCTFCTNSRKEQREVVLYRYADWYTHEHVCANRRNTIFIHSKSHSFFLFSICVTWRILVAETFNIPFLGRLRSYFTNFDKCSFNIKLQIKMFRNMMCIKIENKTNYNFISSTLHSNLKQQRMLLFRNREHFVVLRRHEL